MPKSIGTVLTVGAAGSSAGLAVSALAARGATVRGMVRDPRQANQVKQRGASEVVVADLRDPGSLRDALRGVERVFYIAPAFIADEAALGERFVELALEAGARRIVFSSVIHPVIGELVNHAAKAPVEEAILSSGLDYTFLHPALFFQMLERSFDAAVASGVLAEPWSTQTPFSRVDYRDVAEVAAAAVCDDRLLDGTFELTAPGHTNREQVAALIADIVGRPIEARRIDPSQLGEVPAAVKKMFDHYEHHGLLGNPLTLEAALGRPARTLREFLTELAARTTTKRGRSR